MEIRRDRQTENEIQKQRYVYTWRDRKKDKVGDFPDGEASLNEEMERHSEKEKYAEKKRGKDRVTQKHIKN